MHVTVPQIVFIAGNKKAPASATSYHHRGAAVAYHPRPRRMVFGDSGSAWLRSPAGVDPVGAFAAAFIVSTCVLLLPVVFRSRSIIASNISACMLSNCSFSAAPGSLGGCWCLALTPQLSDVALSPLDCTYDADLGPIAQCSQLGDCPIYPNCPCCLSTSHLTSACEMRQGDCKSGLAISLGSTSIA